MVVLNKVRASSKWDWLQDFLEPIKICPHCDGRNWEDIYDLQGLQVFRCRNCSMMFLNPYLSPAGMKRIFSSPELLQKVSRFFSDYYEDESWATPRTLSIYRKVIQEIDGAGFESGQILDIGCGKGAFLRLAKERGWQAIGVEPNFADAQRLRKEFGIEVFQNDFLDVDFSQKQFVMVSLWDLIEHVPNPRDWIRRCRDILKDKGRLVIATPNHASLLDSLSIFLYRVSGRKFIYALEKLYTIDHTLFFTQATIEALLRKEGFSVIKRIRVNTDLSRYTMSPWFRCISEILLYLSAFLGSENRIIVIARKD